MQLSGDFIFTLIVLILSIILHEIAHGYAAASLGDPTARLAGRLTLNPLKHLDPVGSVLIPLLLIISGGGILFGWAKPVPYNPYNLKNQRWGEAIVAAAGSLTNIAIAILFAFIARLSFAGLAPEIFGSLASTIVLVNLFLGLFNLIPLPPMDGYTTLRSLLPYRLATPLREFEERIRGFGAFGLIGLLLLFVVFVSGPFSALVSSLFRLLVGI